MEFENVPVPRQWVVKVYGYIATLEADEAEVVDEGDATALPEAIADGVNGNWTMLELSRFAAGGTTMHPTIIRMLDVLAERDGAKVSMSEMAQLVDVPKKVLQGRLAALTRHLKANYDFAELGWPMQLDFRFDPNGSRETVYFLSPEQAKRWRRVRAH